jgi:phage terminase large subunit-like protein
MLQFGLRLGARPRQLITTTPRPTALIKRLIADPRTAVTRAATHANAAISRPCSSARWWRATTARGSAGRRSTARSSRTARRAVVARDDRGCRVARGAAARPHRGRDRSAGSARSRSDACGIVAAGRAEDGTIYVLEDATVRASRPPAGPRRRSRSIAGSRPTRWSPR